MTSTTLNGPLAQRATTRLGSILQSMIVLGSRHGPADPTAG